MARRWVRVGVGSGVLLLAVFSGGTVGAQTQEQYASETGAGAVPVLEERVREQGLRLEGEIDRISAVGAELEESQLRAEGARARARELGEQAQGLRRRLEAQEETFRAAKAEYERRARAAYKGGELRGITLLLDDLFGSGEGGPGLAYPRLAEVLFGGRESLEAYEESRRILADTARQIS